MKTLFYLCRWSFLGNVFSKKKCSLLLFRSLSKKLSNARRNVFGGIFKTAFHDSRGTFCVNYFSEKNISSFSFWAMGKKVPQFSVSFTAGMWELHSKCPEGTFGEQNIFLKTMTYNTFRTSSEKFWVLRQFFLAAMLSHLHSTSREERFGQENVLEKFMKSCFLADFWRKKLSFLAKMFWHVCQNCTLLVQKIIFGEHMF